MPATAASQSTPPEADFAAPGAGFGIRSFALLFLAALALRLAALPFSQVMDADATWRVWMGWRWAENPAWITHHVWGPFHFYLNGIAILAGGDPYWAPILLHLLAGAALAPAVAWLTATWFGSRHAAWAGWAAAVAPLAFRASLMPLPEVPAALATVLAFGCVARARGGDGARWALAGGLALTLAAGLRFEIWALIPVAGLALRRRPGAMVLFLAFASVFPAAWMASCWMATGDPLFSIHATSHYSIEVAGLAPPKSLRMAVIWLAFFPFVGVLGLTPPLALAALSGMWLTLRHRPEARFWLAPAVLLGGLIVTQACISNVTLKGRYLLIPAMLALPFIAVAAEAASRVWPRRQRIVAGVMMIAAALPLGYLGRLGPPDWASVAWKSIEPLPGVAPGTRALISSVRAELRPRDGLILDFVDWQTTEPIGLASRWHPDDVFIVAGDAGARADMAWLAHFLELHPAGIILLADESVFLKTYAVAAEAAEAVDRVTLILPGPALTLTLVRDGEAALYRYSSSNAVH